jgi:hypothetical protein
MTIQFDQQVVVPSIAEMVAEQNTTVQSMVVHIVVEKSAVLERVNADGSYEVIKESLYDQVTPFGTEEELNRFIDYIKAFK